MFPVGENLSNTGKPVDNSTNTVIQRQDSKDKDIKPKQEGKMVSKENGNLENSVTIELPDDVENQSQRLKTPSLQVIFQKESIDKQDEERGRQKEIKSGIRSKSLDREKEVGQSKLNPRREQSEEPPNLERRKGFKGVFSKSRIKLDKDKDEHSVNGQDRGNPQPEVNRQQEGQNQPELNGQQHQNNVQPEQPQQGSNVQPEQQNNDPNIQPNNVQPRQQNNDPNVQPNNVQPGQQNNDPNVQQLTPEQRIAKLEELKNETRNEDTSTRSSQAILKDILTHFDALSGGKDKDNVEIETSLDKGSYEVESFQLDDEPGKTYYRVKVEYTIKAKDGTIDDFVFSRTISTNATTPEDAIKVANQFKNTVINLAKQSARGDGDMKQGFVNNALTQKKFSFSFSSSKNGNITSPTYVRIAPSDKNRKNEDDCKSPIKNDFQKKFIYDPNTGDEKVVTTEKETDLLPGQVMLTEDEYLLKKHGYTIKNESLYNELKKDKQGLSNYIQRLQDDIKKQKEAFDNLKSEFSKKPSLNWLQKLLKPKAKAQLTEMTDRVIKDTRVREDLKDDNIPLENIDLTDATNEMIEFVNLKQKLEEAQEITQQNQQRLEELNQLKSSGTQMSTEQEAELKNLEDWNKQFLENVDNLARLEKKIAESQSIFSKKLSELRGINQGLNIKLKQLEDLKTLLEGDKNYADPKVKASVESALKLFNKDYIGKLGEEIQKKETKINKIFGYVSAVILEGREGL